MNWQRILGIGGVIAVIVVGTAAFMRTPLPQNTAEDLQTAEVELRDLEMNVTADGKVAVLQQVPMQFGAYYTVREVLVEEGDTVRAGDVIALLDTTDYELALQTAQTDYERKRNTFDRIVNPPRDVDLMAAQASLDAAEADYWAAGETAPSEEEIAMARLGIDAAKNDLWQAQLNRDITVQISPNFRSSPYQNPYAQEVQLNDGLNQAETAIGIAETQYDKTLDMGPDGNLFGASREAIAQAEISLDNLLNPDDYDVTMAALAVHQAALTVEQIEAQAVDFQLVAPFDGIVTESNLEVGQLPPAGAAVVLADTSVLTVDLEVDETDVARLTADMPVTLTVDALPEVELTGTITTIDYLPMPQKSVPTYRVTVALAPSAEAVQPGMTAAGTMVTESITDAVVIPTYYITQTDDGAFVNVIIDGALQQVAVTTGHTSGGYTQILDGLTPGQRVALVEGIK
jgi:HlyD family secretion protein